MPAPDPNGTLVIGAGPAGLAAAAFSPSPATVLEALPDPGRKILASGGGRCNVTRVETPDPLLPAYGPARRFAAPAIRAFPPAAIRAWLDRLGVPTRVEDRGCVFPRSGRARDVLDALLAAARANGARFRFSSPVAAICVENGRVTGATLADGRFLPAARVILAAGGCARPALGSDGSGYRLAAGLGHRIVAPVPGLAPILVADAPWIPPLAGISLPDAALRLSLPRHPPRVSRGPLLFTHRGLSGPAALDLSAAVARALEQKTPFTLHLAVLPAPRREFLARLDTLRRTDGARHIRRELAPPLPQRLADALLELSGIPTDTPAARLSAPAADRLATALCDLPLSVTRAAPFDESMVASGGVTLKEVDPATLGSRLVPGLRFAGEILDLDGPCGGYNLTWALASGRLAATAP